MKKMIQNLQKAIPPKARLVILFMLLGVGVVCYLLYSLIGSSPTTPAENGFVKIDSPINTSAQKAEKVGIISKDNTNAKLLGELKQKEIETIKASAGSESYVEGIDLSKGTELDAKKDKDEEKDDDIIDIGALFKDMEKKAEDRKINSGQIENVEIEKNAAQKNLDNLGQKMNQRTGANISSDGGFNKADFIARMNEKVSQQATASSSLVDFTKLGRITKLAINEYKSEASESAPASLTASAGEPSAKLLDGEATRAKYMERYEQLRGKVESRINGNIAGILDSTENTDSNKTSSEEAIEAEYPFSEVLAAGEVFAAINSIELNTDENNVVRAVISSNGGMYNGILIGKLQKAGDLGTLTFNSYSIRGQKSYPISAIAIDPETWKSGLADDVDHHFWERYSGIVLSALAQGYGESLTSTSTTTSADTTNTTSEAVEGFKDRLMYAAGKVGSYLAPKFMENVNRESTVVINADRPIGIMLMADFKVPLKN